jgi:hypothetical protein
MNRLSVFDAHDKGLVEVEIVQCVSLTRIVVRDRQGSLHRLYSHRMLETMLSVHAARCGIHDTRGLVGTRLKLELVQRMTGRSRPYRWAVVEPEVA